MKPLIGLNDETGPKVGRRLNLPPATESAPRATTRDDHRNVTGPAFLSLLPQFKTKTTQNTRPSAVALPA